MPFEIDRGFGREFALRAFEWLFATMDEQVSFQVARMIACVAALVATVGLFIIIYRLLQVYCKLDILDFHSF